LCAVQAQAIRPNTTSIILSMPTGEVKKLRLQVIVVVVVVVVVLLDVG